MWPSNKRMPKLATSDAPALNAAHLFRLHAKFVAAFLHRLGAPSAELDDLVQEVFMVAHRRGGFRDDGTAKATTWLAAIAVRVFSEHRRNRSRRPQTQGSEELLQGLTGSSAATTSALSDHHQDPAAATANREAIRRVAQALDALDEKSRAVFVLYEIEGENCTEIAHALQIPVGTVYSRLHQARRAFQRAHEKLLRPAASSDLRTARIPS